MQKKVVSTLLAAIAVNAGINIFCMGLCGTGLSGTSAGSALAETIQAGIEHSDYLPTVSNSYVPGYSHGGYAQQQRPAYQGGYQGGAQMDQPHANVFQQSSSQSATPQNPVIEWFQIPRSMAGSWVKKGDLTLDVTDLRNGIKRQVGTWTDNEMVVHMGHQMDRSGNVWHVNILPSEKDSTSNGKQVRFMTVQQICEQYTPSNLSTRTHYVITETYGGTGQVADMFQQESINHYSLLNDGEMQNMSSNRVFTYNGKPVRDGTLQSKFNRIGPFEPLAQMNGVDLAQSLNQFLSSRGAPQVGPQVQSGQPQQAGQQPVQQAPPQYQQPIQQQQQAPQQYQQPMQQQQMPPQYMQQQRY